MISNQDPSNNNVHVLEHTSDQISETIEKFEQWRQVVIVIVVCHESAKVQ